MADVAYIGPGGRERLARPLLRTLIGDVLRRRRQAQRRTLADVAQQARVSKPYLSELERGRKEASSEVLAAVCDALRIELPDLLAEVGRDLAKDRALTPSLEVARRRQLEIIRRRGATPVGGRTPTRLGRGGDVVLLAA